MRGKDVMAWEGFEVNSVGFGEVVEVIGGWVAMVLDEEGFQSKCRFVFPPVVDQCEGSYALGPEPKLTMLLVGVMRNLEVRACDEDNSFEGVVQFMWNCCGCIGGGGIVCDEVD